MKGKIEYPLHFEATIEEILEAPAGRRWHAQFKFYPLGYFRGYGRCPGTALRSAWKNFKEEVDPGRRWWTIVQGQAPPIRY